MNDVLQNLKTKLKTPKTLIIAGLVGVGLIFLSGLFDSPPDTMTETANFNIEAYKSALQQDIEALVTDITGSSDVTCLITLESSVKYSYADTVEKSTQDKSGQTDQSLDTEIKEGYITVKTADGGEAALIITESMPEVRGVAIVCPGGDNEAVAEKIKSSVTAALNISSKKVYICGRNS